MPFYLTLYIFFAVAINTLFGNLEHKMVLAYSLYIFLIVIWLVDLKFYLEVAHS